ncbi:DUF4249 family protein [Flavimarina sp. Hel_I_48]|uniref:DUF4249 family protein n=1 Tax=Flavimarina sp. Hel_I_48 TaxID=1392488 RepID=UPI0004DEFA1A|nr:DUF4249 family protein [Flavimarina sp. Hel_I_48]
MKKLRDIIVLVALGCTLFSCQDVIDVDLPESEPRLVVDALIKVPDREQYFPVAVRLTTTAPFDTQDVPQVTGAQITVEAAGRTYFVDEKAPGFYSGELPKEVITTENLELIIEYNGERYAATSKMQHTVPIDSLSQGTGTLFSGDETEIIVSYTDPAPTTDYYLFDLDFNFYLLSDDRFYQGNSFSFSYFYDDLEPGSVLVISILGVDKPFYDYMSILIAQSGQDAGGPFQAPPAEARGNIINTTNPENYPLGYFAIAQQYSATITTE